MSGVESRLQTVVASDIEVNFTNFGVTEVPLAAAFDPIGAAAAAPLRCQNPGLLPFIRAVGASNKAVIFSSFPSGNWLFDDCGFSDGRAFRADAGLIRAYDCKFGG